jgi:hypothetical protein
MSKVIWSFCHFNNVQLLKLTYELRTYQQVFKGYWLLTHFTHLNLMGNVKRLKVFVTSKHRNILLYKLKPWGRCDLPRRCQPICFVVFGCSSFSTQQSKSGVSHLQYFSIRIFPYSTSSNLFRIEAHGTISHLSLSHKSLMHFKPFMCPKDKNAKSHHLKFPITWKRKSQLIL